MPDVEATADLPVLTIRRGFTASIVVWSVAWLIVAVTLGGHGALTFVNAFLVALFWGGLMSVVGRRQWRARLAEIPRVSRPAGDRSARALRLGLAQGCLAAVFMTVCLSVIERLIGAETPGIVTGFAPGMAFLLLLGDRRLQNLQKDSGLILFTRSGAKRFVWTRAQANEALVAVPAATPNGASRRTVTP